MSHNAHGAKDMLGILSQRIFFPSLAFDDTTPDGLADLSTAYKEVKIDAYRAEQELADKYRAFVAEIMRLSLAAIGVFAFLIVNIKAPIPSWGWWLACAGVPFLGMSVFFAMRFSFGSCEGLRWYIAGLRYSLCAEKTKASDALKKRTDVIRVCRHDKFSSAFFLIVGALCMAVATMSAALPHG
jgi:hypothetical protein